MAADTTLSISRIEVGLSKFFDSRRNVIVPKVSWGLLTHEADLLILSRSGYLTEIEIKRSWTDFLADFRKNHTHDDPKISWRYYAVPESILSKCTAKLNEVDPFRTWGLISYRDWDGECMPKIVFQPWNITKHDATKKLTSEEQFTLARLGAMRVWNLKEKLSDYECTIIG